MAKLRQRQTICGGAIRNQENFAVGFKKLTHSFANSLRPLIVAVRTRRTFVSCLQLRPGFRTNRGGVVARKFVTIGRSVHPAFVRDFFADAIASQHQRRKKNCLANFPSPGPQASARQITSTCSLTLCAASQQEKQKQNRNGNPKQPKQNVTHRRRFFDSFVNFHSNFQLPR